ncbi:MAG: DUF2461 domain-containing protein [Prevotella sp.]|nr:DUF2461 domain-containing protein [Prevotella sp.]
MNTKLILGFLSDIAHHNSREWMAEHQQYYKDARNDFERGVAQLIPAVTVLDSDVAHITVKDATYRFNRDTRFSPDKSPYKRHFGAYIAAHGKKAFHGGYYIHLEPGKCMVACGNYCLPTNILNSCRNEIMANIDTWLDAVENDEFVSLFGQVPPSSADAPCGFGIEHLKTCPSGFPKDYEYIKYLRMKDYCCWHNVDDSFYDGNDWIERSVDMFRVAKPMMDIVNSVIDDYE